MSERVVVLVGAEVRGTAVQRALCAAGCEGEGRRRRAESAASQSGRARSGVFSAVRVSPTMSCELFL